MADQKKDDMANALAALAGGAVPSEGETLSGGIPSESTVFSPEPVHPPVSPPSAVLPPIFQAPSAMPSAANINSPLPPRVGTPSMLPKELLMPSAVPPPARIRPASLDGTPARARPAMPERPVAAPAPAPVEADDVPEMMPELIEDEETIAAAPDASAFARRVATPKRVHAPVYANLFFRRTIIPILLTCGILFSTIGLWTMLDHNAPLAAVGSGVEWMLVVIGAILFVVGIVNMLHVKHVLKTTASVSKG